MSNGSELGADTRLELSRRAMVVVQAPAAFVIRCLQGGVWITQEARRGDFFLRPGEWFEALPRKRVFVDAFRGAVLALGGAATCRVDATKVHRGPQGLRLKIAQGAYTLSGGDTTPFDVVAGGRNRPSGSTVVTGCLE